MGLYKEFKEFAFKGNVLDLAIAVVIGAAFASIVSSLVDDVITPLLLTPALEAAGAQNLEQLTWGAVKWGKFLAAVIKFFIVAIVLFALIQGINRLRRKNESTVDAVAAPPELSLSERLLMEIRDDLKK